MNNGILRDTVCSDVGCWIYHIFTLTKIITANLIWDKKMFMCLVCCYCEAAGSLQRARDLYGERDRGGVWMDRGEVLQSEFGIVEGICCTLSVVTQVSR